jgi:hypothetical protein
MSTRITAVESTQNEFKQQLSEELHSSQQNTMILNNLSSMLSIMMKKLGNPVNVCEPKLPTPQNTNSHMPSLESMLISWDGSAGDTTRNPVTKVIESEAPSNVAKLNGEDVMGGGKSPEGASEVGGIEAHETFAGGLMEGGAAAVEEPNPSQGGNGKDGFFVQRVEEVGP